MEIVADHYHDDGHEGYVVILNTLAKFFSDTMEDVGQYCDEIVKAAESGAKEYSQYFQAFLTFGDFDRMTFKGIDRFARFYDLDQQSKYWLGKHQNVFLYRIRDDQSAVRLYPYYTNEEQDSKKKDFGFCYQVGNQVIFYSALTGTVVHSNQKSFIGLKPAMPFLVLTQVSFSNELITRVSDYSVFMKSVKGILRSKLDDRIMKMTVSKGKPVRVWYDIYGCMNTSEMAILWVCSQYTEVLELIDYLKSMDFKVTGMSGSKNMFFSFYSVIGRTLAQFVTSKEVYGDSIPKCEGTASINLSVSDSNSAREVLAECKASGLPFENYCIMTGEHDINMQIPANDAYDLLCEEGIESTNSFFRKKENRDKFLGVKISLFGNPSTGVEGDISRDTLDLSDFVTDSDDIVKQFAKLNEQLIPKENEEEIIQDYKKRYMNDSLDLEIMTLRELYLLIRVNMKDKYNSHTGSVDTLDMLYTDYLSNIHDTFNALWRNDYHYQFKKSLVFLLEKVKAEEGKKFWDIFTVTVENLRQQTEHFSQSGALLMQIPASHLRYTASADMLFHSYYGATKAILENAYRHQTPDQLQSELLPIITTNITPMIKSRLFRAGQGCDDLRILQVDIPYSLLFDPVTGFPYLVHEMFHYFAPSNRAERNGANIEMAVNEALTFSCYAQIEQGIGAYLFEELHNNIEDPDTKEFARKNGFDIGTYDSYWSDNYQKNFHRYMAAEKKGDEVSTSRESALKCRISHIMWRNPLICEIREVIVKETIKASPGGHPERQTWTEAMEMFWRAANRLTSLQKNTIAEQLAASMRRLERYLEEIRVSENDKSQREEKINNIRKEIVANKYILTDAVAKEGADSLPKIEASRIDNILYQHKYSLLNPNLSTSITNNSLLKNYVTDVFMKGLREAVPDYAMVRYCGMSDIDYLVTYARFTRDTNNSVISGYDIIRVCFVLLCLSEKEGIRLYDEKKETGLYEFQQFAFEEKQKEFVEQYVAEYMPHSPEQEKILDLLSEAIWWLIQLMRIASKFKRDYDIYYDCFLQLKKTYDLYFEEIKTEEDEQLGNLVRIVKEHRTLKLESRKKLISETQWTKIYDGIQDCKKWFVPTKPTENRGRLERAEEIEVIKDILHKQDLNIPGITENDYKKFVDSYNRESFDKILQFIQICERQKTFETLAKIKNGNMDEDEFDKPDGKKEIKEATKEAKENKTMKELEPSKGAEISEDSEDTGESVGDRNAV